VGGNELLVEEVMRRERNVGNAAHAGRETTKEGSIKRRDLASGGVARLLPLDLERKTSGRIFLNEDIRNSAVGSRGKERDYFP